MDEIIGFIEGLDGVLAFKPGPGDGSPEIAWGDAFFYYAPGGVTPASAQPFATIVTKNYPDEPAESRLDRPGAFRVNVAAGKDEFIRWTGHSPRESTVSEEAVSEDAAVKEDDVVAAHPVYGALGWLAVVNPGVRTGETVRDLLRKAYELARARHGRRAATGK